MCLSKVNLADYSSNNNNFLGRKYEYKPSKYRGEFQRDRDRVIHSNSFRRLKHKTQVFIYHEGDHFRTRLTHSLEVSQIARSIARSLNLNEDLCEVLSLAHDLGHTPFGHAGEDALNKCLDGKGVFDHNIQTLRILILLEDVYSSHPGLNLSLNTLDGLLKHNGPINDEKLYEDQIPEIFDYNFNFKTFGSLEAQIASLSDDIAYNCHDIDDGLRANLFDIDELKEINFISNLFSNYDIKKKEKLVRVLLNILVTDLLETSKKKIEKFNFSNIEEVYNSPEAIISFSDKTLEGLDNIRNFLKYKMYEHNFIKKWNNKSEIIISNLYNFYKKNYKKIPNPNKNFSIERNVSDYISGMTDNFAIKIHEGLK